MSTSDSMFLFEVAAVSVHSLIDFHNNFNVKCHLPNYFTVKLKEPKEALINSKKKVKSKQKLRIKSGHVSKCLSARAIIVADGEKLLNHLKEHKLELSLWNKSSPEIIIGASSLPWSQVILNYLKQLMFEPPPAKISHEYYIFDETMTKRVAIVKLVMKLALLNKNPGCKKNFKFYKPDIEEKGKELSHDLSNIEERGSTDYLDKDNNYDSDTMELHRSENIKDLMTNETICDTESNAMKNSNSSSILITDKLMNSPGISFKSNSFTSFSKKSRINTLKHVFGDYRGPYGDKIYCVGYMTVENDKEDQGNSNKETITAATTVDNDAKTSESKYSLRHLILQDCKDVRCENRCFRPLPDRSDQPILLDITTIKKEECCVTGKMEIEEDPCQCTCKCTFGFTKKTTYCGICGGYEKAGEEFRQIPAGEIPYPCPIYHKLIDKNKLRQTNSYTSSHYDSRGSSRGKGSKGSSKTSQKGSKGSDKSDKKKLSPEPDKGQKKRRESRKSMTRLSITPAPGGKKAELASLSKKDDGGKLDIESEKEFRKPKKKRDNRFKFNYGYQAPKIGHAHCFDPCTGSLKPVPNHMGWLWTAGNVPGMKFRPHWRPGATHKNIVKLLRQAKNPDEIIGKKKKKDTQLTKKKRPLKRPLLVVNKKHGEFSITIEQMKEYSGKDRSINQPPFEDKAPMTFKVGRTEEENMQRKKKKLREQRRLERAQRMFIQNTFQDLCHEICLKTYQQALGILPDAEKPDCACCPALPDPEHVDTNVSCSCSENSTDLSDTDSDEWVMEFNPPNCFFKPSSTPAAKKNSKVESESQYTYLDYRVKILDKSGNEIPRFFIGPDGKQTCSDLGGFKGPDGKWLQIGLDGYIAPDGRWAPHSFTGPNGETIESEDGKFTTLDGDTYTVGVDGYVINGVFRFYAKPKSASYKGKYTSNKGQDIKEQNRKDKDRTRKDVNEKGKDHKEKSKGAKGTDKFKDFTNKDVDKKPVKQDNPKQSSIDSASQYDFSCFGTTSPKVLSEMGIRGHGHDRKLLLATLQKMLSKGIKVKIPEDPASRHRGKVGTHKTNYSSALHDYYVGKAKCKHSTPSPKGILCCDEFGRKTYFKIQDPKNPRPKQRLRDLHSQGKSVSSFHIPCFDSFINYTTLCNPFPQRSAMPYCQPAAAEEKYTYVT